MLLPDKEKKTYKLAMKSVKELLNDLEPTEIVSDFETAFLNTVEKIFPNTRIKGCHFHFGQCVFRHVQQCGLQNMYSESIECNTAVKLLIVLSFVPVDDVVDAYNQLIGTSYFAD